MSASCTYVVYPTSRASRNFSALVPHSGQSSKMEQVESTKNQNLPAGQDTTLVRSSFRAGSSSCFRAESMPSAPQEIGVNNHIPVFLDRTFRMVEQVPDDIMCWSTAGDSFIIKQVGQELPKPAAVVAAAKPSNAHTSARRPRKQIYMWACFLSAGKKRTGWLLVLTILQSCLYSSVVTLAGVGRGTDQPYLAVCIMIGLYYSVASLSLYGCIRKRKRRRYI